MKRNRLYLILALAVVGMMGIFSLTRTAMAETNAETASVSAPLTLNGPQSGRHPGDVSFLTGPTAGEPLQIVQAYIANHRAEWGLSAGDLSDMIVTNQYTDVHNGVTHIYLRQRHQGIEVYMGNVSAHVTADGRIVNLYSDFVSDVAGKVNSSTPALTPADAVTTAAAALQYTLTAPLTVVEAATGPAQRTVLSNGGISTLDIPVHLVYYPTESGLRLAWVAEIESLDFQHYWEIHVDAANGEILYKWDHVVHENFDELVDIIASVAEGLDESQIETSSPSQTSGAMPPNSYEVFAMPSEYPDDGPRVIVTDPANATASPFGWHDTNGVPGAEFTVTRGNNVSAYDDQDNNGTPSPAEQPDGGPTLDFTGALVPLNLTLDPRQYVNAAVVNLFYWNNIIHDVFYLYGFNEVSGNFQVNNYGNGGLGNDDVRAEAQDGGGTNNANFLTPADGSRPRMQMYLWTQTTPRRDGDLENSIILHEYGHGISIRLTGGPAVVNCLNNSEQMGEGWSDWFGLVLTAKATDTDVLRRGIGTYVLGQPVTGNGIRPAPYSTDMTINNYTYANLPGMAVPHGVGFVWATMTWDMYWKLVDAHGFNPDFYAPWNTGGNNLAIQLIMDGLKLQPCSPGFVNGRNAILQADVNLTGGANQCLIWEAFARRGLGFSASQGSSTSTSDGTPAFDIPPSCSFLGATPTSQSICVGSNATYAISVGQAYSGAVNMSASGHPAGTTATFVPNPVTAPGNTNLTIGNTAGATPGNYNINVVGVDASQSSTVTVGLDVLNAAPAAPTLVSPPNGASGVSTAVTLSWNASPSATSYTVEVATDAGFTNIIHTNTVAGTSDTVNGLAILTTYHWRVRATNPCGTGTNSAVFTFTTGQQFCNSGNIVINASGAATPYPSNIVVSGIGTSIVDVDVSLTGLSHTWPNDIDIMLVGPQGQNLVFMSDAGGSVAITNVNLTFDDSAASNLPQTTVITSGTYRPTNYAPADPFPAPAPPPSAATTLATFNSTDPNGTWSMYVFDDTGGDSGSISGGWCLQIVTAGPTPTPTAVPPTATPTATAVPPTATPTEVPPTATATTEPPTPTTEPPTDVQLSSVAGSQSGAGSGWFTIVVGVLLLGLAGFMYVRRQPVK
ncbi:MAG: M36 family metallopeptidase [Anaerolineae bacterium]|nr:M36 family metallopeptidase [Anaerolineae bacterium]